MHLAELLARRPVPAAAVFLAITQRCPLRCAHCSTMSGAGSPQQPAGLLRRFVASFTPADHPEFLLLTGGEPLLRPGLVAVLAQAARSTGTRSYVLTGAFFARGGRTPGPITAALNAVDHVAVSVDRFHEAEVPRRQAFRILHDLADAGRDVSIQACGTGPADPYLADLTRDVRREFGDRVPMLVTTVQPVGRGRAWLPAAPAALTPAGPGPLPPAAPCDLASWPVVGFDGTIAACCNQDVLDARPVPAHLRIGHIASATWPEVRRRVESSPVLRGLRTRGPLQLAHGFAAAAGRPAAEAATFCETCCCLSDRPAEVRRLSAEAETPAAALIEQQALALQLAAGPAGFARRHGDPARADLVLLGHRGTACGAA
jgi:hypothetical protein